MTAPSNSLETFPNPAPERDYTIRMTLPEFTCLCPKTGQPDFATLDLEYVPNLACVELKSLKLYIWSFRDRGAFHEAVVARSGATPDATEDLSFHFEQNSMSFKSVERTQDGRLTLEATGKR